MFESLRVTHIAWAYNIGHMYGLGLYVKAIASEEQIYFLIYS